MNEQAFNYGSYLALDQILNAQHPQSRETEFILGYKRKDILDALEGTPRWDALKARYDSPSLWDAFLTFLRGAGYDAPARPDVTQPVTADDAIQEVPLDMYYNNVRLRRLAENLVDPDEGFQEWRYRHVQKVERTIGLKPGTGGSEGVAYLRSTMKPFFPDLWAIRSRF
ncbi:MAG: hypothetical protein GY720_11700 [bacterium]|nr:hypothetical protein [bacterium]